VRERSRENERVKERERERERERLGERVGSREREPDRERGRGSIVETQTESEKREPGEDPATWGPTSGEVETVRQFLWSGVGGDRS
jgi:hypothetical protein